MEIDSIWPQAIDLTNRVLEATSGFDLCTNDAWQSVVAVQLWQADERLGSISMLLGKDHLYSAEVLTRSLFEIAANLSYIAKDTKQRLPEYLKHGGSPPSKEDSEQMQIKLNQEPSPKVKDIVPGRSWRPLRDMCCDLGWLEEYDTFYRFVSVVDHAGSFTLETSYLQLLEKKPSSDRDRAAVLVSALCFHLRVDEIAAALFPTRINHERITEMSGQCNVLGQSLAKR